MLRTCLVLLLLFTAITGLVYPLAMTVVCQMLFPDQAHGSLILMDGRVAGSYLIGRQFENPRHFWSRPSATAPFPYNAASSSGSNYGPRNPELLKAIEARRKALQVADPEHRHDVPRDLLTASGSGLDPHISPAAAEYQAPRVALVRGLNISTVRKLITRNTSRRQLGFLGEDAVNVVALNQALDGE
jgi:K+-transporting ATPase ATPase C chain